MKEKKEKEYIPSESTNKLNDIILSLSKNIRIYDFKEIEIYNGYVGIDSVQLPLFLDFCKNYNKEKNYNLFIEIKETIYSCNDIDTIKILNILSKSKNFFLFIQIDNEKSFLEILLGDFQDDFLIFRSNNIPYKKQRYINRKPFGYIYLKDINNQYLPSRFHFEEPIDIVYTWVNSNDREWQKLFSRFRDISEINYDRFLSVDELKYSLRSVEKYANWVNKIYIVSNCAKPEWLNNSTQIEWIFHEAIFDEDELPTFNSHALGLSLYKIPNLSEHFIYFNDDVFLYNRVKKEDFFTPNNFSISYLEPYGIIYHDRINYATEGYEFSAINGKKLFEKKYGFSPTQLHKHVPLAFKKSILIEMEKIFEEDIKRTRKNRFRDRSDVSVSFLYNHYALYHKEAVYKDTNSVLVNYKNYKNREKIILKNKPKFFCINDGDGSTQIKEYKEWKINFLEKLFPQKAKWEI